MTRIFGRMAVVAICLFGSLCFGDEIVKKNGEILEGEIKSMKENQYYKIRTADGKLYQVKWQDVEEVNFTLSSQKEKKIGSPSFKKDAERASYYETQNSRQSGSGEKSPLMAVVFSGLLPGCGQFYNGNGQELKGALMLGGYVGSWVLYFAVPSTTTMGNEYYSFSAKEPNTLWLVLGMGVAVYSMIDAGICADKINSGDISFNYKPQNNSVLLSYNYKF